MGHDVPDSQTEKDQSLQRELARQDRREKVLAAARSVETWQMKQIDLEARLMDTQKCVREAEKALDALLDDI